MKKIFILLTTILASSAHAADTYTYSFECGRPLKIKIKKSSSKTFLQYFLSSQSTFQFEQNGNYSGVKKVDANKKVSLSSTNDEGGKELSSLESLAQQVANSGHYEDGDPQLCHVMRINISALERANKTIDPNKIETIVPVTKEIVSAYEERYFITRNVDTSNIIAWEVVGDAKKSFPELF